MVASTLVNVPGASEVFNEGYITYSNEAKQKILGVKKKTLKKDGASARIVRRKWQRARQRLQAPRAAISVTGIAGPDGGTEEKPVGLVYFGCCIDGKDMGGILSYEWRPSEGQRNFGEKGIGYAASAFESCGTGLRRHHMGAKDKKKWLLAGLLCLLMWLLCGCVGNNKMSIDTTLEINSKFKGQRVMSAVVSESVFRQAFDGNLEDLQGMVTEKCPSTLICSAEEVNNGVAITMTLEFANLSDYTNKIGQILGKTPGIYFDASNSIFKEGYMLQENFTSQDLFGWLLDALRDKNSQFEDMELSDIFQNGDTKVIYEGETVESEAMIHVERMESHAFDSLSVEMTMNDDGSYKTAVNYIVSQDVYYDMGDDMDAAIKRLMPDGGVYEVNNVDTQRVYTIGFSAYNTETLISQLNSVLHTNNCEFGNRGDRG